MSQLQLTGIVSRQTVTPGMTPKTPPGPLDWSDMDNNLKAIVDFLNLIGGSFDASGSLVVPPSTALINSILPFVAPIGSTKWSPVDLATDPVHNPGIVTPTLNGLCLVEANGQILNQADYPSLFAIYQNKYSWTGDATGTTFRVPDLRRMFLRGRDSVVGSTGNADQLYQGGQISWDANGKPSQVSGGGIGGEESHVLGTAEMAHQHYMFNTDAIANAWFTNNFVYGIGAPPWTIRQSAQYAAMYWTTAGSVGTIGSTTWNQWQVQGSNTVPSVAKTSDLIGHPAPQTTAAHGTRPPYATGIHYIVASYMVNGVKQ